MLASTISATYGGVTTALAVMVLGEHLSGWDATGVVLAVAGVAMASTRSAQMAEPPPIAVGEPVLGLAPRIELVVRGISQCGPPRSVLWSSATWLVPNQTTPSTSAAGQIIG